MGGLPCLDFIFPAKCGNDSSETYSASDDSMEIVDNELNTQTNQALMNYNLFQNIKTRTYWQLNGKWKTEIIIILSVLTILIFVAIFYLLYTIKMYKRNQEKLEPKITKLSDTKK